MSLSTVVKKNEPSTGPGASTMVQDYSCTVRSPRTVNHDEFKASEIRRIMKKYPPTKENMRGVIIKDWKKQIRENNEEKS